MDALVMERAATVMTATPKLNGIECVWDGSELVQVDGRRVIPAPAWWTQALPADVSLRGYVTLSAYQSAMRHDWKNVTFHVFDSPDSEGGYSKRMKRVRRAVGGVDKETGVLRCVLKRSTYTIEAAKAYLDMGERVARVEVREVQP